MKTIIRAERDPYLRMVDNGDGLTYPCSEDDMILTAEQWQSFRDRIDAFYAVCDPSEIADVNFATKLAQAEELRQRTEAARIESDGPVAGYVYLLHGVGTPWYKIGVSVDPKIRLKQLGTQGPFKIEPVHQLKVDDMINVESHFHNLFADKRAQGEWFTLSANDVATFVSWKA